MHEGQGPTEQPTALLEALLAYHDELRAIPESRTKRLLERLDRLHLAWLLIPWWMVAGVWWALRRGRPPPVAGEDRAAELYRQATGVDERTASAEVAGLVIQLGLLGNRGGWPVPDGTVRPGGPDRAEVEAAAAALLGYHLAGRRTDDELLGKIAAMWAEHEEQMFHGHERLAERGLRGREAQRAAIDEVGGFMARYLVAWRHWFDQRAERGTR